MKTINRHKTLDDGSLTEQIFGTLLELMNIKYAYEPFTIDTLPSQEGTSFRYKPIQYTPDFYFKLPPRYDGEIERKIVVETKGFMRGSDSIRTRLADVYFTEKGLEYYIITQAGTIGKENRNFYPYKQKGVAKRGLKLKTFWDIVGIKGVTFETYRKAQKLAKERYGSKT